MIVEMKSVRQLLVFLQCCNARAYEHGLGGFLVLGDGQRSNTNLGKNEASADQGRVLGEHSLALNNR